MAAVRALGVARPLHNLTLLGAGGALFQGKQELDVSFRANRERRGEEEEEEEEEEEGEEEGLVLTWRRQSCTQTGPHSRGLSGATLQSAPLKAPSHLHRPV